MLGKAFWPPVLLLRITAVNLIPWKVNFLLLLSRYFLSLTAAFSVMMCLFEDLHVFIIFGSLRFLEVLLFCNVFEGIFTHYFFEYFYFFLSSPSGSLTHTLVCLMVSHIFLKLVHTSSFLFTSIDVSSLFFFCQFKSTVEPLMKCYCTFQFQNSPLTF